MSKYGLGQRVTRFTLVETCVAFHAQVGVLDPVEHEERTFDPTDFTQSEVQPVLLAVRPKLAQDFRRFERLVAYAGREPHDVAPMLPYHLFVDRFAHDGRQSGPRFCTPEAGQSPVRKVAQTRREGHPQQMEQGKDVVRHAASICVMNEGIEAGRIVQEAIEHERGFACGCPDDARMERPVLA